MLDNTETARPLFDALARLAARAIDVPHARVCVSDENGRCHGASGGFAIDNETKSEAKFRHLTVIGQGPLGNSIGAFKSEQTRAFLSASACPKYVRVGIPIVQRDGRRGGALCLWFDRHPISSQQSAALDDIAITAAEAFAVCARGGAAIDVLVREDQATQERELDRVRLTNIISAAHAGTWEWNIQTNELRVNARWAELIDSTPAALAPMTLSTWEEHTHPEDWKRLRETMNTQIENGLEYVDCEIRMRGFVADWVWVRSRGGVATWLESGAPLCMYGTLFDISKPKATEQRLRESEAFLDRTGRVAGVGGWEIDLEDGAISWSDQTCRLHEVPLGHRPTLEEALNYFPGGSSGPIGTAMRRAVASGNGWDVEAPFVTATGRPLWVRTVANIELRDAKPRWLIGAIQDVTARRRAVDALQVSERRFRNLFERSLGLICTHDMNGVILSVNPATANQLGYPLTSMLTRPMTDYIDPSYHDAYAEYLRRISANGIDNGFMHVLAKDGSTRVWQYENVVDDEGQEPFVLGHAQDVTASQSYARQLRDWSIRDPLTRCFNRRYLGEVAVSLREGDIWGCIVFDLDHFKQVNDTRGHERGDEVLVAMGQFLKEHVRPEDIVVRLGGDEFLLLLKGSDESETARAAERIEADATRAPIRFTLGYAVRSGPMPLRDALKAADDRLYEKRQRIALHAS